ncbi:unnamed protein product [Meganyctiphanes norvegica]|uniref:Uncharacterized protein n=1 Tax=Meganyctiphanes norvegica TaxID=48144 RepID=A0AAV2SAG4_MEGNR
MSHLITEVQVIPDNTIEGSKTLNIDRHKKEQVEVTVQNDESYIKEQADIMVHSDDYLASICLTHEPYIDTNGDGHCYWCHVCLRNLKLYTRPWIFCKECNITKEEVETGSKVTKQIIRDENGNTYCPWCEK